MVIRCLRRVPDATAPSAPMKPPSSAIDARSWGGLFFPNAASPPREAGLTDLEAVNERFQNTGRKPKWVPGEYYVVGTQTCIPHTWLRRYGFRLDWQSSTSISTYLERLPSGEMIMRPPVPPSAAAASSGVSMKEPSGPCMNDLVVLPPPPRAFFLLIFFLFFSSLIFVYFRMLYRKVSAAFFLFSV